MELRMKEDIFVEVTQSGGQLLLHREEFNPVSNRSTVIGYWENISLDDVKTPAEVYAALISEGFNIVYRRIPLTREREALATDVDAIQHCKDEYVLICSISIASFVLQLVNICLSPCNFNSSLQFWWMLSFHFTHWIWWSCLCNGYYLS